MLLNSDASEKVNFLQVYVNIMQKIFGKYTKLQPVFAAKRFIKASLRAFLTAS